MTVRSASHSLVIVALGSMGGDCYGGPYDRACYTGLGTQGTIQVVIGNPTAVGGPSPSCAGIDGLLPGTTVTLTATKPPDPICGGSCYSYETTSVGGLDGVTLAESGGTAGCHAFTHVPSNVGRFSDATTPPACTESWQIRLQPVVLPERGTTISVFDAGSAQAWTMWRRIGFAAYPPSPCGTRPDAGKSCEDEFLVQSIANVTP